VAPTYNQIIHENGRIGKFNIGSVGDGMYGLGTPEDLNLFLANSVCKKATIKQ
jgi:hypothetical protein